MKRAACRLPVRVLCRSRGGARADAGARDPRPTCEGTRECVCGKSPLSCLPGLHIAVILVAVAIAVADVVAVAVAVVRAVAVALAECLRWRLRLTLQSNCAPVCVHLPITNTGNEAAVSPETPVNRGLSPGHSKPPARQVQCKPSAEHEARIHKPLRL